MVRSMVAPCRGSVAPYWNIWFTMRTANCARRRLWITSCRRPSTYGPDAKILAGGQSLLPMMKFRLARPSVLVDLQGVRDLAYVQPANGAVAFGGMARLSSLESDSVRSLCPILAEAAL